MFSVTVPLSARANASAPQRRCTHLDFGSDATFAESDLVIPIAAHSPDARDRRIELLVSHPSESTRQIVPPFAKSG